MPVSRIRTTLASAAIASATLVPMATPARASAPHMVLSGETLWSIAAAYNFTTRTVAAYNGLSEDASLVTGETIQVPAVEEGAAALASAGVSSSAPATSDGVGHVVQPGETLSGVAAANGLTTATLAAHNGLAEDAWLIAGETIQVPTSGSAAAAGAVGGSSASSLGLAPGAAESWDAMNAAAVAKYGVTLQSAGPLSGYRTYEQQAYLYDLYLAGEGAPANPPGTSTHELGIAVDLVDPYMRTIVDEIGWAYGWTGIGSEWWHVQYVG